MRATLSVRAGMGSGAPHRSCVRIESRAAGAERFDVPGAGGEPGEEDGGRPASAGLFVMRSRSVRLARLVAAAGLAALRGNARTIPTLPARLVGPGGTPFVAGL